MGASFWEVVADELEYQGMTRKWLASKVNIDVSTIAMGLKRKSIPQVDLALKIAEALKVPIEYLVTGKNSPTKSAQKLEDLRKYHKYAKTIESLDALPDFEKIPIINLIKEIEEKRANKKN
ncbi:MAG: helix-turn-helix transcriptional regulator [Treponema sp.]|nr:helix-turn-helix transcriptional regulator [Treponema sp.]